MPARFTGLLFKTNEKLFYPADMTHVSPVTR
jgi:hypothetical protein